MKKKFRPRLPDGITDDLDLFRRFKVELAEVVAAVMNESDWKKFAIRFGLDEEILDVTSRQVVWLFLEQLRLEIVPVFHRLQRRLAAQG